MEKEFLKGVMVGSFLVFIYKYVDNLKWQKEMLTLKLNKLEQSIENLEDSLNLKLKEFERRLDNLEDFKLRFYQIYTIRDHQPWDEEDSDNEDEIS
jgi:hypothetical protein